MLTQPLFDKLTQLRLPAFREALEEQMHNPQYAGLPFEDRLGLLVDRECIRRDNNRLQRRLRTARLPLPATVEDLDLSPSRGIDRRLVLQLAQGEWINQHLNILVLGPTGVGKTFTTCALAHSACRHDFTVRYYRTSRLLHHITLAHADGSYPKLLDTFARTQLLVLDDWLRDPLTRSQSQDLLEILDDRYDRSSTMVVTQVPVADWHVRFPDPTIGDAILDRLVHNAYRLCLKGESRRKTSNSRFDFFLGPTCQIGQFCARFRSVFRRKALWAPPSWTNRFNIWRLHPPAMGVFCPSLLQPMGVTSRQC